MSTIQVIPVCVQMILYVCHSLANVVLNLKAWLYAWLAPEVGTPVGLLLVVTLAHWPPLAPVVLPQPTELMVVTVGVELWLVNSVAWYSMSVCVPLICDGQPRSICSGKGN